MTRESVISKDDTKIGYTKFGTGPAIIIVADALYNRIGLFLQENLRQHILSILTTGGEEGKVWIPGNRILSTKS